MILAERCYLETRDFPREESFGLTSQIRRAAVSIPANIAEGYGREHRGAFAQFLRQAQGSLKELETHLLLSERVGLLPRDRAEDLAQRCDELGAGLYRFIASLRSPARRG